MNDDLALKLYLSATCAIIARCQSLRNEARTNPIYKPDDVDRVIRLADRQEAKELRDARIAYERSLEAVKHQMAAE